MKRLTGTIVRASTPKTAFVKVVSEWMHPKYLKKTHVSTVFACHDEIGVAVGDEVVVVECRPLSATKHFKIERITKKGSELVLESVAAQPVKTKTEDKPKKTVKKAKATKTS